MRLWVSKLWTDVCTSARAYNSAKVGRCNLFIHVPRFLHRQRIHPDRSGSERGERHLNFPWRGMGKTPWRSLTASCRCS
jgi:hypothetical protein